MPEFIYKNDRYFLGVEGTFQTLQAIDLKTGDIHDLTKAIKEIGLQVGALQSDMYNNLYCPTIVVPGTTYINIL